VIAKQIHRLGPISLFSTASLPQLDEPDRVFRAKTSFGDRFVVNGPVAEVVVKGGQGPLWPPK